MKLHLRLPLCIGALVFALLPIAPTAGQGKKPKNPNYYPLEVGNTWRYSLTKGKESMDATASITKIDTLDGIALARLEVTFGNTIGPTEHWRQTSDGVFRYRMNGMDISPPICLLKYPLKADAKWEGDITVGIEKGKYSCETKEESIEVAAVKYKAIRVKVRIESQGKVDHTTFWFAPEVGVIRQTIEGDVPIQMDLTKFEHAKKK